LVGDSLGQPLNMALCVLVLGVQAEFQYEISREAELLARKLTPSRSGTVGGEGAASGEVAVQPRVLVFASEPVTEPAQARAGTAVAAPKAAGPSNAAMAAAADMTGTPVVATKRLDFTQAAAPAVPREATTCSLPVSSIAPAPTAG
jgi:hypothetical protein